MAAGGTAARPGGLSQGRAGRESEAGESQFHVVDDWSFWRRGRDWTGLRWLPLAECRFSLRHSLVHGTPTTPQAAQAAQTAGRRALEQGQQMTLMHVLVLVHAAPRSVGTEYGVHAANLMVQALPPLDDAPAGTFALGRYGRKAATTVRPGGCLRRDCTHRPFQLEVTPPAAVLVHTKHGVRSTLPEVPCSSVKGGRRDCSGALATTRDWNLESF